jgi:cell wall-associated NlpC family hydrolase
MLVLLMLAAANGVVSRPVINLYSGPSDDRDVVSQAIYATNVPVIEEQAGWLRIRTPDDYSGWVRAGELLQTAPYASSGRVAHVASLFANVYREANITRRAPMLTLPYETRLEVTAEPETEEGRWVRVRLPDDRAGWIQRGDVTFELKPLNIEETVLLAKRFLGLPYLWGGTSTFGYDCSGFTQMLLRRRGVVMPRDAGPQARWDGLAAVARDDIQPGDLLYFGPSEAKTTHTGMYIGDGQFIHATAHLTPVVQISALADAHWTELLVACRRLK